MNNFAMGYFYNKRKAKIAKVKIALIVLAGILGFAIYSRIITHFFGAPPIC